MPLTSGPFAAEKRLFFIVLDNSSSTCSLFDVFIEQIDVDMALSRRLQECQTAVRLIPSAVQTVALLAGSRRGTLTVLRHSFYDKDIGCNVLGAD